VTLPELEYARLSWLAGQAGLDAPTEAAKLLIAAIRKAADGWRRLLDSPTASVEELDRLLQGAVAGEPDEPRADRIRDIEHAPSPTYDPVYSNRPLHDSYWDQPELPDMPAEVP
jgi:hypothetical protein